MPDSSQPARAAREIDFGGHTPAEIVGVGDATLKALERRFPGVDFIVGDRGISVTSHTAGTSDAVDAAAAAVAALVHRADQRGPLTPAAVADVLDDAVAPMPVVLTVGQRTIRPKTPGQRDYVRAIEDFAVVFGIGPAGTGKTYLAMAKAVHALQANEVSRIILTRPAVEAGENLGFLPGSLHEKIDPYLRPLFDAMAEMMDPEVVAKLTDLGVIEVAPLAYMRGRTLNDAFIILDEAQNTTIPQMQMFLTRLGFGSRMVVTGDASQGDLRGQGNGLLDAQRVLADIPEIAFVRLTSDDVVRHGLVSDIVDAYDRAARARLQQAQQSSEQPAQNGRQR